jgi:putative transposase
MRRHRRQHRVMVECEQLTLPDASDEVRSIDFVLDALADGRFELGRRRGIGLVARFHGYPKVGPSRRGPEFTSRVLDRWAYANDVTRRLIQAGNRPARA